MSLSALRDLPAVGAVVQRAELELHDAARAHQLAAGEDAVVESRRQHAARDGAALRAVAGLHRVRAGDEGGLADALGRVAHLKGASMAVGAWEEVAVRYLGQQIFLENKKHCFKTVFPNTVFRTSEFTLSQPVQLS